MNLLTTSHVDQMPLGALVSNYLMSSYAYEHLHAVYMDDSAYDRLCKRLDEHFDEIAHQHKHLVDRSALSATTGYYLKDLPMIVQHTAKLLVQGKLLDEKMPMKRAAGPPSGFAHHGTQSPTSPRQSP